MSRFSRASGVLLHPTALPGPYGIGCIGAQALAFLDWMQSAGLAYWQICPLAPTGYGDSPYQGFSAFAGNPNLIDLDDLLSLGLVSREALADLASLPADRVDFGRLIPLKAAVLAKAWRSYIRGEGPQNMAEDFGNFRRHSSSWLEDYALFMVLKERHGGRPWSEWEDAFRFRDEAALQRVREESEDALGYHAFVQYLFHRQWGALKGAAADRGIGIIGDIPIFIAFDSADCWSNPEMFRLDDERLPTHVAGVPPDYFSETGQLWGNPLYDWSVISRDDFSWWISVLRNKLENYDVLRIDHFRGFAACWSVPYGQTTAVNGEWVPSPGKDLFARAKEVLGDVPIIAEDLGVITPDVEELIAACGFPGMKVLQFAFDSAEENDYLPHNFNRHCLVYTGTHDNDTVCGWFESASEDDRENVRAYLNLPAAATGADAAQAMLRAAMASVSDLAITPLQDILGLDSSARFNTPGTLGGNWDWRAEGDALSSEAAAGLRKLAQIYGRLPAP